MTRVRVELVIGYEECSKMFMRMVWGLTLLRFLHTKKCSSKTLPLPTPFCCRKCLVFVFFSSPEPRERLACFPLHSSDSHSSHITIFGSILILWIYMLWVCIVFCIFFSRCETKKCEYEDESLKLAGGESCLLFSMVLLFGVGSTVYGCCYLLTLTFSSPRFHFHQISVLAS